MTTEKFDLSKKTNKIDRLIYANKLAKEKLGCGINGEVIFVNDVKEFIRELKKNLYQLSKTEILFHCEQCKEEVFNEIDKLAGKELIEGEK